MTAAYITPVIVGAAGIILAYVTLRYNIQRDTVTDLRAQISVLKQELAVLRLEIRNLRDENLVLMKKVLQLNGGKEL